MAQGSSHPGAGLSSLQQQRILAISKSNPESVAAIDEIVAGTAATHVPATDPAPSSQGGDGGNQQARNQQQQQDAAVKAQMDPANQLSQYRDQLAKDMQRQGLAAKHPSSSSAQPTKRVSPILEESAASTPSHIASGPSTASTNASTESSYTIRGAVTPGFVPRTPSYPFPRVTTPGYHPQPMHRPFTTLSPTGSAPDSPMSAAHTITYGNSRAQDKILSNPSTPASAMSFFPAGVAQSTQQEAIPDFPTPNLYELSLMLTSEPGLDAWWRTVVHIMTVYYRAERLTLAVPADSTDLENIPWGQKATYNSRQEDNFSMEYMAMSGSAIPSSREDFAGTPSTPGLDAFRLQVPLRPKLPTRHSFGSFEEEKQKKTAEAKAPITTTAAAAAAAAAAAKRPGLFTRSKSFFPVTPHAERTQPEAMLHMGLNQQALAEHDAEEPEEDESWPVSAPERENTGRVFELLQALDYEADPLIDHHGVTKVLERGRVIALTRSYPYLEDSAPPKNQDAKVAGRSHSPEGPKKKGKKFRPEASAKLSSILGSAQSIKMQSHERRTGQQNIDQMISEGEPRRPPTPTYEEYEQAPPSPWSQSPAPSPAIRADPKENPFFASVTVDESCFDPTTSTPDYAAMGPQEAIGVDNAWTVLHIPLRHPLLSKVSNGFKLDPKLMEQKSARSGKLNAAESVAFESLREEKPTPIAILSILSSTIPYPSNLRYSLEHLAPHLATSLSLCRHYSVLESEVTRMHRRKPRISGFGAVDADGRPITDPAILHYSSEDVPDHSLAGSLTSPSEYSMQSRSAAGTPGGTPGWEMSGFGVHVDKRTAIAGTVPATGDSYFTTKTKVSAKTETSSTTPQRPRRGSKDSPSSDKRSSLRLYELLDSENYSADAIDLETAEDSFGKASAEEQPSTAVQKKMSSKEQSDHKEDRAAEIRSLSKIENLHRHRKLHSHGGDFATTFQSLPPGASIPARTSQPRGDTTITHPPEMAWPTDRLKDLILDSLPAQLFVATVPAGGIVWVNSRYIAYRGQTLAELYADPHASIHPDDREAYLSDWGRAVRTGEDFQMTVRIRRFDGAYRCFSARVVACRNRRNVSLFFSFSFFFSFCFYT